MNEIICKDHCPNLNGTCPNVRPYADGSKRHMHSETKCKICGDRWLWGLSWDGSGDGKFNCGHKESMIITHSNHKQDVNSESGEVWCETHKLKICHACGVEINNDEGVAFCPNHFWMQDSE